MALCWLMPLKEYYWKLDHQLQFWHVVCDSCHRFPETSISRTMHSELWFPSGMGSVLLPGRKVSCLLNNGIPILHIMGSSSLLPVYAPRNRQTFLYLSLRDTEESQNLSGTPVPVLLCFCFWKHQQAPSGFIISLPSLATSCSYLGAFQIDEQHQHTPAFPSCKPHHSCYQWLLGLFSVTRSCPQFWPQPTFKFYCFFPVLTAHSLSLHKHNHHICSTQCPLTHDSPVCGGRENKLLHRKKQQS